MIEVEVQNETHQTQEKLRFAAVPRIGEGLRLREPNGLWASYDVLDVWYQRAEYGDVWTPFLHVCMTPAEEGADEMPLQNVGVESFEPLPEVESEVAGETVDESVFASLSGEAQPSNI